jgi:hypothetical protein
MRGIFLGDSYDLVKRFWCESLKSIAPLYAHPRFVASGIRPQYTAVTSIAILDSRPDSRPDGPFGLLFDPDTGIPLPTESPGLTNASHVSLPFMVQTDDELHPQYMICFDQSYHRQHELSKCPQVVVVETPLLM